MKVWPIKNKVIQWMDIKSKVINWRDIKGNKDKIARMERDREIARIANLITEQMDILMHRYKKDMGHAVHHILKDELK